MPSTRHGCEEDPCQDLPSQGQIFHKGHLWRHSSEFLCLLPLAFYVSCPSLQQGNKTKSKPSTNQESFQSKLIGQISLPYSSSQNPKHLSIGFSASQFIPSSPGRFFLITAKSLLRVAVAFSRICLPMSWRATYTILGHVRTWEASSAIAFSPIVGRHPRRSGIRLNNRSNDSWSFFSLYLWGSELLYLSPLRVYTFEETDNFTLADSFGLWYFCFPASSRRSRFGSKSTTFKMWRDFLRMHAILAECVPLSPPTFPSSSRWRWDGYKVILILPAESIKPPGRSRTLLILTPRLHASHN